MAYRSVLYRKQVESVGEADKPVSIDEAITRIKKMASLKANRTYKNGKKRKDSDQTIDIAMHLGIDPRQADQMLRGALSLPHGIGKSRTVIAFCDVSDVDAAKEAGAIEAGGQELVDKIQNGWLDFDVAVAHPSMMGKVGKLGRVLGPQGKMPTPKAGTVTPEIMSAIKEFSAGRLEFRNDKGGNIHLPVGRTGFEDDALKGNIEAVIAHITKLKPASMKGHYIKKISLSATRTPPVLLEMGA